MKYYKVIARCGHVKPSNYYLGDLYFVAENAKDAAKQCRNAPRVKHDHKFAIMDVIEITKEQFVEGIESHKDNPYWNCRNIQEQRMYMDDIEDNIYPEEWSIKEEKKDKWAKKHNLRNLYNNDPEYEYFKNFEGCNIAS